MNLFNSFTAFKAYWKNIFNWIKNLNLIPNLLKHIFIDKTH